MRLSWFHLEKECYSTPCVEIPSCPDLCIIPVCSLDYSMWKHTLSYDGCMLKRVRNIQNLHNPEQNARRVRLSFYYHVLIVAMLYHMFMHSTGIARLWLITVMGH